MLHVLTTSLLQPIASQIGRPPEEPTGLFLPGALFMAMRPQFLTALMFVNLSFPTFF
jgi:hypothetical protein